MAIMLRLDLSRILIAVLAALYIIPSISLAVVRSGDAPALISASSNLPLVSNASDVATEPTISASQSLNTTNALGIYCRSAAVWFPKMTQSIKPSDCYAAMASLLVFRSAYQTRPFFFQFQTPNDDHHRNLPIRFHRGSCAVVIFPRQLTQDSTILDAEPELHGGLSDGEVSNYDDLVYDAQGVYDTCLLKRPGIHNSPGWLPTGLKGGLFIGFWGVDSDKDRWLVKQMDEVTGDSPSPS